MACWPAGLLACPWPASIVVFAAAEIACHAQRLRVRIHDDHGVRTILMALPAVVFHGLAGAVLAGRVHLTLTILLTSALR